MLELRRDELLLLAHESYAVTLDRQRRALLLQELADARLATRGIHDALGEQLRLACESGVDALRPACAHRVEQPVARRTSSRPLQLRQHVLQVRVAQQHVVHVHDAGRVPLRRLRNPRSMCRTKHAVTARAMPLANPRMRRREHIARVAAQFIHETCGVCLVAVYAAAAEQHLQCVADAIGTAALREQPRQTLRATVTRQQAQSDFRLTELRIRLGDAVMTGEGELHAAAQRHALDRRDARLAHPLDAPERQLRIVRQHTRLVQRVYLVQKLADVGAGHERRRAVAREHHRLHVAAARQVVDDDVQLVQRTFVECIHGRVGDVDRRHLCIRAQRVVLHAEVAVALEQLLLLAQLLPALPFIDRRLQFRNGLRVAQRALVTDVGSLDQCTDHAAHVLAAARFRELRDLDEVGRHGDRTLLEAHQFTQPSLVVLRERASRGRLHERQRRQSLLAMRCAHHDHVAHRRVGIQLPVAQDRALDLLGAHAVTGDVDHVVTASVQRERVVVVAHGEVALRVRPDSLPARPVGAGPALDVTLPLGHHARALDAKVLAVAPDRARQVRIGRGDHDLALLFHCGTSVRYASPVATRMWRERSLRIDIIRRGFGPHVAHDPRQRISVRIRPQRKVAVAVEVRPRNAAMLRGPVRIDVPRRQQVHAELLHRGRRGLRAEGAHAQRRQVVAAHVLRILHVLHDELQECHAGLEDADLVPLDDRREPPRMREHRRSFREHARHARRECGRDHVALSRDPSGIGDDVHHVAGLGIERHAHRVRHAGRVPAMHMHHALRLAGGPRRVDEEQRELRIQRRRRTGAPDRAHELPVGQGEQLRLGVHVDAGGTGGRQHRLHGGIRQIMAPAIALLAPHDVLDAAVAHHHHRIHARWHRHQRGRNGRAHTTRLAGVDVVRVGELLQCASHTAHHITALHGDLARERLVDGVQQRVDAPRRQREAAKRRLDHASS